VREQDAGNFWQYNGPCKGDELTPAAGRYPLPAFTANQADFAHFYDGDGRIRNGRAMGEFSIDHPFGSGRFATRVRLYAGLPRIDVQTTLVNNEERVRYRAAMPTSIVGGTITYEIPFGAIERPEGEFPAQTWVDYGDGERGLALLNRGLPGNNVVDGVMMISLLKCTNLEGGYGDMRLGPETVQAFEKGQVHTFDYALVPHSGDWRVAQLARRGAEFNRPLLVHKPGVHPGALPPRMSFIRVEGRDVVFSCVRACPGGMIVRVYDATGSKSEAVVEAAWPLAAAYETDLLERDERELPVQDGRRVRLVVGPFEIKTVRLLVTDTGTRSTNGNE
jgi:alpha-mannosidase